MTAPKNSGPVPFLGEAIKRHRGYSGKTQGSVAREIGVSSTYMSMLECGRRTPGVAKLAKVAEAIGCKLSDVFHLAEQLETLAELERIEREAGSR